MDTLGGIVHESSGAVAVYSSGAVAVLDVEGIPGHAAREGCRVGTVEIGIDNTEILDGHLVRVCSDGTEKRCMLVFIIRIQSGNGVTLSVKGAFKIKHGGPYDKIGTVAAEITVLVEDTFVHDNIRRKLATDIWPFRLAVGAVDDVHETIKFFRSFNQIAMAGKRRLYGRDGTRRK